MKVYLVVDEFQYEGGFVLFDGYIDSEQALIRQQKERWKARKVYTDYEDKYGKELSSEKHQLVRLEAITIKEVDII